MVFPGPVIAKLSRLISSVAESGPDLPVPVLRAMTRPVAQSTIDGCLTSLLSRAAPPLAIIFHVLLLALSTGSAAERGRAALGSITGSGSVRLNGNVLPPGASVFAGDAISTGTASAAVVKLLAKTSAGIGESTALVLAGGRSARPGLGRPPVAGEGIRGSGCRMTLDRGVVTIVTFDNAPAEVDFSQAAVIASAQPGSPAAYRIAVIGSHALVLADRGHVEVHSAGARIIVPPGESARLEARAPQAGTHVAGEIADSMPDEVVLHPGEHVEAALGLGQLVNVGDSIRTLETGRLRVHFFGDPYLNVGPDTAFKITNHSPESQYTRIDAG